MKRLMIALMLALILVASACAEGQIWEDYAPTLKQQQEERGKYQSWSVEDRVTLVRDLMEMGYLTPSADTDRLLSPNASDADRQAIADALLLALTGEENIAEIDYYALTYAILGWQDFWTPAQRVWWQDVLGYNLTDGSADTFVIPTEDDLPEVDAIAAAKEAIIKAYLLEENALDGAQPVADLYITRQRPDMRRWHVSFILYKEGTPHYELRRYEAIVNQQGIVIEDPDIDMRHVSLLGAESVARHAMDAARPISEEEAIYDRYAEKNNLAVFWSWPYEDKAAYSAEAKPLADQKESIQRDVAVSTFFAYGMPGAGDMQHEQALLMAQEAIMRTCGVSQDDLVPYTLRYEAFDVTDPDAPLWKFVFINPDDWYGTRYRVKLNARTGETVMATAFPWRMFDWGNELDYIIEWYF